MIKIFTRECETWSPLYKQLYSKLTLTLQDGLTALNIAQKLGYISVIEVLKELSYDGEEPDNKNWEEKYKVIAPESLQETSFISDSDEEGGTNFSKFILLTFR